ncbi:DUF4019 domain-containing protein [Tahibacter sp.]|uniref:DUF4019 domain-containing protein n=1 Tax=Tahibacter sp. TaxID=2056211 RepID=UPI0028C3E428|nr:DUF4019 domain-containing protein [Tahibacter sp.]
MRLLFVLAALLLTLPVSAQKAQEPTLPQMNLARNWLELLDAGRFEQAWTEAAPSLRSGTDLARWTQDVRKARHSDAAVTCRHGLALERLDHPPRIAALFVTEFADGHRIGEKVTLPADAAQAGDVTAYRAGPPATGRGGPCDSGRPATTGSTP